MGGSACGEPSSQLVLTPEEPVRRHDVRRTDIHSDTVRVLCRIGLPRGGVNPANEDGKKRQEWFYEYS